MKGLSNTTVLDFSLPKDSPGQIDLVINAAIDTTSNATMRIAELSFDIVFDDELIGDLYGNEVTLQNGIFLATYCTDINPINTGVNKISMGGALRSNSESSLRAIEKFMNQYISGLSSSVFVRYLLYFVVKC